MRRALIAAGLGLIAAAGCKRRVEDRAVDDEHAPAADRDIPPAPGAATPTAPNLAEAEPGTMPVLVERPPPEGVPECHRYVAVVHQLMRCDKIPQSARDGVEESLKAVSQSWMEDLTPDLRRLMGDACRSANEAMIEAAKDMGCPLAERMPE